MKKLIICLLIKLLASVHGLSQDKNKKGLLCL